MKKQRIRQILGVLLTAALLCSTMVTGAVAQAEGTVTMTDLTVCGLEQPLGLDLNPAFSWVLTGQGRDESQAAYRLRVSSTAALAEAGEADVWDSGRVESPDTLDIAYGGSPLATRTAYYWTAESFLADGSSVRSQVQWFSTGINQEEWQGQWIGATQKQEPLELTGANWIWLRQGDDFAGVRAGTQYFRYAFTPAADKTVNRVQIGYAADDQAVFYFNGVAQGSTSAWTTGGLFDATDALLDGENTVAIAATNGTVGYAGLLVKIRLEYTDGSVETIVSDGSWAVAATLQEGWNQTGFDDSSWAKPDQQVAYGESPWGTGVSLELYGSRAAVLLRKEFDLSGEVAEAYAYICGLGFFELTVNGQLPDNSLLNPFTTQYNMRVLYRTFDVTQLLQQGGNAVGVELGNSYYNEIGGVWNWPTASWRDNPKLLFQLEIHYTDGTTQTVVSDLSWKVTTDGPITSNSMYYGETYDARKEQTGFNETGFDAAAWKNAVAMEAPEGQITAQTKTPVKRVAQYAPADITRLENGSYVLTAPEMVAGWMKLSHIHEAAGQEITITYGQRLDADGTVVKYGGTDGVTANWWPHAYIQQDHYICKGSGDESYEPKFSFKGHLYIQIDGLTGPLTAEDVVIYRVSNGVDIRSDLETSDALLNQLHQMMRTAMANNFQGEHCDPVLEKNGWTGDANVSLGSLMYNFDMSGCLPGWLQILGDCFDQYDTVPVMAPTADWWIDNSIVWNSLYVYGVQALTAQFGMEEYEAAQYDTLRRYTLMQISQLQNNGWVWMDSQLGDWVAPIGGSDPNVQYNENISEGSGITGTAFAYGVLSYMADLADKLEKPEDAAEYRAAMSNVYDAFQTKFYKADKGYYETNTWTQIGTRTRYRQTDNLVALAFGLVPERLAPAVAAHLVEDIQEKDYHLDTGCVGTKYLLPMLCEYGYGEVAFRILTQDTYPSWGYWVENGATSTWEMWEATTRSYDHYFLGTYEEWFYRYLAGVTNVENGYETFTVKPEILGDLTQVDCTLDTVRGLLTSGWARQEDGSVTVTVTVPFGATAKVVLPTNSRHKVTLDGQRLTTALDGVRSTDLEDDRLAVMVGSGAYTFQVQADLPVYKLRLTQAIEEAEALDAEALSQRLQEKLSLALEAARTAETSETLGQTAVNEARLTLVAALEAAQASLTPPENLALHKPVTASSTNNDSYWGWDLSYLNDGVLQHESRQEGEYTGYCSNLTPDQDHQEWVVVDLQAELQVTRAVIYPASTQVGDQRLGYGIPLDFQIQISSDGENWETVYAATDYPLPEYGPLTFDFDPVTGRYVRLLATRLRPKPSDGNSYRLQISELELYDMTPREEILLGDLNEDGKLTVTDVVLLRKAILAGSAAAEVPAGDFNGDGALSVTDVVLLRKAILQQS